MLWLTRRHGPWLGRPRLPLSEDEQRQEKEQDEAYCAYGDRDVEEYGGYDGSGQDSAS